MTSSEIIKNILEGETALIFAQDLFIGREPERPSNTVTIFDTVDQGPQLTLNNSPENKTAYDYTAIQIRVRHVDYKEAMNRATQYMRILHNRGNEIFGEIRVTLIEALDNPSLLDWDKNDRARIITNYSIQRTPQPVIT